MKIFFLLMLIIFFFSCSGTPETVEIEEIIKTEEATIIEESIEDEIIEEETIIEEIAEEIESEITEEELLAHMIEVEEEFLGEHIEEQEEAEIVLEGEQIEDIVEIAETEIEEESTEVLTEVIEPVIEEEPVIAELPEIPAPLPEPEQQAAIAEPEPVTVPEIVELPEPEPQPEPAEQPRRPPVSTALLGPAEERVPPPPLQQRPPVQQRPNIPEPPRAQPQVRETPNIVEREIPDIARSVPERQEIPPFVSDSDSEFRPVVIPDIPQNQQREETNLSRSIRAVVGQTIEVPFRGTNWVYLGELASRRGIAYSSRRLDTEGQSFIFRAEEAGTYVLNFSRQDYVRGFVINDHVQVIVSENPDAGAGWFRQGDERGRVIAEPRWPSALEEAEILSGRRNPNTLTRLPDTQSAASDTQSEASAAQRAVPGSSTGGVTQTPPTASSSTLSSSDIINSLPSFVTEDTRDANIPQRPAVVPPDTLLQRARESFDAGNVAAAIAHLDQYRLNYPGLGEDELFWLYGQFYEANSPSRDILLSLDYYRRLVREYPQSVRLTDARRRIAYLERFYININ